MLSGGAVARVNASALKELVITDSIQATDAVQAAGNIRVITIAALIGEAISTHRLRGIRLQPVRLNAHLPACFLRNPPL